jgi:hypothetical protein
MFLAGAGVPTLAPLEEARMSIQDTSRARGRRPWVWLAPILAGVLLCWAPAPAAAHETREILGAKYTLRIGFAEEPAYQGLLNGISLAICTGKCVTDPATGVLTTGVVGAFETVKAEVSYGNQTMALALMAVPRQPGHYVARFVPTRAGDYTFRIYGELGGERFDERFTSSPTTFDSVQPATAIQFPDNLGYPPAAPAAASTATAAPRPTAPVTVGPPVTPAPVVMPTPAPTIPVGLAEFQVLRAQLRDQQQQLEAVTASAAAAHTFAIGGLGAGAIGVGIALLALLRNRRPGPAQHADETGEAPTV